MAFGNANLRQGTIVAVVPEQERGDAGGVGLKRQDQHVIHELNVLSPVLWNARRGIGAGILDRPKLLRLLNACLDFADAGEVLVELVLVVSVQPAVHAARLFHHEIEHRPLFLLAALQVLRALSGRAAAKEPLENHAWIGFRRHGGRGRTPGEVELVGAGIARIARARSAHRVAAQLQRREARQMTDLASDGLVDGNAGTNVRGALLQANASEEDAVPAGVVAGAVRPAVGGLVVESAEHLQVLSVRLQRFQRRTKLKLLAFALRPPGGWDGAVRKKQERGAQRRPRRGRGQLAESGRGQQTWGSERFERGQGDTRAESAQELATGEAEVAFGGDVLVRVHRSEEFDEKGSGRAESPLEEILIRPEKFPAVPGDPSSLTVPGSVSAIETKVAAFPLTPALSNPIALTPSPSPLPPNTSSDLRPPSPHPMRRRQIRWARVAGERGNFRLGDGKSDGHGSIASRDTFPPLPGGEGRGEGEQGVPTKWRAPIVASGGESPEGQHGCEPFIVSILRLCRGSLAAFGKRLRSIRQAGLPVRGQPTRWPWALRRASSGTAPSR